MGAIHDNVRRICVQLNSTYSVAQNSVSDLTGVKVSGILSSSFKSTTRRRNAVVDDEGFSKTLSSLSARSKKQKKADMYTPRSDTSSIEAFKPGPLAQQGARRLPLLPLGQQNDTESSVVNTTPKAAKNNKLTKKQGLQAWFKLFPVGLIAIIFYKTQMFGTLSLHHFWFIIQNKHWSLQSVEPMKKASSSHTISSTAWVTAIVTGV